MKAKNYLKQIKILDAKINNYIEELASLEALATKTTSVLGGEKVQASGSQEKMADCVIKIVSMKEKLSAEIDSFLDYKEKARKILSEYCDADCCRLLHMRYFMYNTWEEIAVKMDYTYQWVSDGLHQKALSQLQKGLDDREKREEWEKDI